MTSKGGFQVTTTEAALAMLPKLPESPFLPVPLAPQDPHRPRCKQKPSLVGVLRKGTGGPEATQGAHQEDQRRASAQPAEPPGGPQRAPRPLT